MPKRIEFEGTVHEFPDDFTDEDIAAALDGAAESPAPMPPGAIAGVGGVAAMAPAIVSGVNTLAKTLGRVHAAPGMVAPGILAYDAAKKLERGDVAGAVKSGAMGVAVPLAAKAIQKATNPAVIATRGSAGRFMTGGQAAGPLMRGASAVSKLAEFLGVPLAVASSLYDAYELTKLKPLNDAPPNIQAGRPWE